MKMPQPGEQDQVQPAATNDVRGEFPFTQFGARRNANFAQRAGRFTLVHSAPTVLLSHSCSSVSTRTTMNRIHASAAGVAHAEELERLLEQVVRVEQRRVDRAAVRCHDVGFAEDLHRRDEADDQVEQDVRAEHRHRDVAEPPPRAGAVDAARPRTAAAGSTASPASQMIIPPPAAQRFMRMSDGLLVDSSLQPQRQREAKRLAGERADDALDPVEQRGVVQPAQRVIDQAVVRVEEPDPQQARGDQRHDRGHVIAGAVETDAGGPRGSAAARSRG